jgi:hypothetical protein
MYTMGYPAPQPAADAGQRPESQRGVGWVLPLIVTIINLVLIVPVTLLLALVASIGPDSCGEGSCHGDALLVKSFLVLAAVAVVAPLGSWLTMRPALRPVQLLLAVAALILPVLADAVAFALRPAWM